MDKNPPLDHLWARYPAAAPHFAVKITRRSAHEAGYLIRPRRQYRMARQIRRNGGGSLARLANAHFPRPMNETDYTINRYITERNTTQGSSVVSYSNCG